MIGKRELRYSLRTGYLSNAKSKARLLAGQVQQLFNELRRSQNRLMELTDQQIQKMATKYLERVKATMDEPFGPDRGDRPYGDKASLNEYINGLADNKEDIRDEIAMGDYWRVKEAAVSLLSDFGVGANGIDEDSASFAKLCEWLLAADIRGLDYHKARLTGTAPVDIERAFNGVLVEGVSMAPMTPEPEEEPSILLPQLWELFKAEKVKIGRWRGNTIRNHTPKFTAFVQFVGDIPVNQVTKPMARDFRMLLDHLPPNFTKKGYPDLSVVSLKDLKGKHDKTLSVTTVRDYMLVISAMFNLAVEYDYIPVNPVTPGMIPDKKRNAREQRLPFSDPTDLNMLFDKELFIKWSKDRPERFWAPIISLYTGCRLEEACQLHAEDVKKIEGYWCFDFKGLTVADKEGEEEGQMLKNESAPRAIPLHPFLIDVLKLPEYASGVPGDGNKLLFPNLTKGPETNYKYSHGLSKAFSRYKNNKVGIKDSKKTFHSFRHTLTDNLKNEDVSEWMIEELEGRAGKSETSRRYSERFRVEKLYDKAISKLNYKVDLSHLFESKYVPKG